MLILINKRFLCLRTWWQLVAGFFFSSCDGKTFVQTAVIMIQQVLQHSSTLTVFRVFLYRELTRLRRDVSVGTADDHVLRLLLRLQIQFGACLRTAVLHT